MQKWNFYIVCIGYNLRKYHNYRIRNEEDSKLKGLIN